MANRIEFAVSATPIKSTTFDVDYTASDVTDVTAAAHDYIEPTIGKTLGGNGSIALQTSPGVAGYSSGSPTYVTTTTSGISLCNTAKDLLFVRNPGLTTTGTASVDTIIIKAKVVSTGTYAAVSSPTVGGSPVTLDGGTTSLTQEFQVCTLAKGEAIILPLVTNEIQYLAYKGGSVELKVEYATIT